MSYGVTSSLLWSYPRMHVLSGTDSSEKCPTLVLLVIFYSIYLILFRVDKPRRLCVSLFFVLHGELSRLNNPDSGT